MERQVISHPPQIHIYDNKIWSPTINISRLEGWFASFCIMYVLNIKEEEM